MKIDMGFTKLVYKITRSRAGNMSIVNFYRLISAPCFCSIVSFWPFGTERSLIVLFWTEDSKEKICSGIFLSAITIIIDSLL